MFRYSITMFAQTVQQLVSSDAEDHEVRRKLTKVGLVGLLFVFFYIVLILLFGQFLWNTCLVPSVTIAKKITMGNILGIHVLFLILGRGLL